MKEIIFPGELVSDGQVRGPYSYIDNGKTYSMVLGMYESGSRSIVPLEGAWVPRVEDTVVGIIRAVKSSVYEVDLMFHGRSLIISGKFEKFSFRIGDVVEATIKDVEDRKTIILSYPRLLDGGMLLRIRPSKIPRVIGKANTMIKQICDSTKSSIVVGKNGFIWIKGGNVPLAIEAMVRIESEAHVSGLTERIKNMVEKKSVE